MVAGRIWDPAPDLVTAGTLAARWFLVENQGVMDCAKILLKIATESGGGWLPLLVTHCEVSDLSIEFLSHKTNSPTEISREYRSVLEQMRNGRAWGGGRPKATTGEISR